jgi:putative flavoprotein involved in K+ transport
MAKNTHPGKDDVADYLAAYAAHFSLPVRLSSPVRRMHRDEDGCFVVTTPTQTLRAAQVVVATGPFQAPRVPELAAQLDPEVVQLHSAHYRNPGQLPDGADVLVVGAANSGLQIAAELVSTCSVTVAVGSRPIELPQRLAGRDLFFWLSTARFFTVQAHTRVARRLRSRGDIVIGTRSADLQRRGIAFRPRLTGLEGRTARFADGSTADVDAVLWATGYRSDYSWLHVPGVVVDGEVRHQRGVTDVPGLYVIGLPWQTSRGSALLGFVGADAAELDQVMAARATEVGVAAQPIAGLTGPAAGATGATVAR